MESIESGQAAILKLRLLKKKYNAYFLLAVIKCVTRLLSLGRQKINNHHSRWSRGEGGMSAIESPFAAACRLNLHALELHSLLTLRLTSCACFNIHSIPFRCCSVNSLTRTCTFCINFKLHFLFKWLFTPME